MADKRTMDALELLVDTCRRKRQSFRIDQDSRKWSGWHVYVYRRSDGEFVGADSRDRKHTLASAIMSALGED